MKKFSQRFGLTPDSKEVQKNSLDIDFRNQIWNFIQIEILHNRSNFDPSSFQAQLRAAIWCFHWKKPIDEMPTNPERYMSIIKSEILTGKWYIIYDLIEFLIEHSKGYTESWTKGFNKIFELENSAYRFIGRQLIEISSTEAISAIKTALSNATNESAEHLRRALALMSDRENPDYRNSIKESISAVESTCKFYSGKPGGDLNECLRLIKKAHPISSHFEQSLLKLYHFTNQGTGIRHALTEDSVEVTREEARYMVTVCAAFCDYLWGIAAKK